jgi:hypothetical protein
MEMTITGLLQNIVTLLLLLLLVVVVLLLLPTFHQVGGPIN